MAAPPICRKGGGTGTGAALTMCATRGRADWLVETDHGLRVAWRPELDGGGDTFGRLYPPIIRAMFGRVGRVFECCAGPGFIGFSLLAAGLCDSLALADINPAAVAAARETVAWNGLANRVRIYESDGLRQIEPDERWDLVVGNPPHFRAAPSEGSLILHDPAWRVHRNLYAGVARHLTANGSVLLLENYMGSRARTFMHMIRFGGLEMIGEFMSADTGPAAGNPFYFLWSRRTGDTQLARPQLAGNGVGRRPHDLVD